MTGLCPICKEYVDQTDDNTCMDCDKVFCPQHIHELSDGSCDCLQKHCIHDNMHDGLRCSQCSQDREIDIGSSMADSRME